MNVKKVILLLVVFLFTVPVLAQVDTAWVRRYDVTQDGFDIPYSLMVDSKGNVYAGGWAGTVKYSSTGEYLWSTPRGAYGIAVDSFDNLYLADGLGVIKYSADGESLRFNGFGLTWAGDLALDSFGNIYVTGGNNSFHDFYTIKYNNAGDTFWFRQYIGPNNFADSPGSVAVDTAGNVYVMGSTVISYSYNFRDYATVKYSPTGEMLWDALYNGPNSGDDVPFDFEVDSSGNVYVTGRSIGDTSTPFNYDYATIKYSTNGDTLWVRRYNGPADGIDEATAIGVDDSGNVYVTGVSRGIATSDDIATIKYSSSGEVLWLRRYDGPNGWDGGNDLALDKSGNIYVAGYSRSGTLEDFITIKYSPQGEILWQIRYNGPVDSNDVANLITLDNQENVYITGRSIGSHNWQDHDYATIKYVQYTCIAKPGDSDNDNEILLTDITTIVNSLFKSQPAPNPLCRGDVNVDGKILLSDIVYLINFLYKSGPAPVKNRECCL